MYGRSFYTPHARERWKLLGIFHYVLSIFCVPVACLRLSVGSRTIGILPAILNVSTGIIAHLVYCEGFRIYDETIPVPLDIVILPPHEPSSIFLLILSLTVALVTLGWITAAVKRNQQHSRYSASFVSLLFPRVTNGFLIAALDSAFFLAVGWHLRHMDLLGSWYLMIGSMAACGKSAIESYADTVERLETQDAVATGRITGADYRQGGRFNDPYENKRLHY